MDNPVETFLVSLSVSLNLAFTISGKAYCLPSTSPLVAVHDNVRNTKPVASEGCNLCGLLFDMTHYLSG